MATEISRTVLFHFLFSGLTFTFLVTLAISSDPYLLHSCANNTGNYTANSAYERDLNTIFKQITSITKSNYRFYNKKVGEVNAMALCRADVKLDVCTGCLNETISRVKLDCPNNKEAIRWSANCTLRYSNTNLSEKLEINPQTCPYNTGSTPDEYFQLRLGALLSDLHNKAAAGGALLKYAAGDSSLRASERLYALVQCTPDLSEGDCNHCLDKAATDGIRWCCLKQRGCRVLSPSCNLSCNVRYEIYPFYNLTVVSPQPPPAPERTPILVASLSVIFELAVVFISGFFTWRRRNSRDKENSQEVQLLDLVNENSRETFNGENGERSQEFPSIKLDVLHAATYHFSDENKLGQGGFGPVYKGTLADGKEIAVKRLSETSSQGLVEFKNEIMLIAKLQHRNLAWKLWSKGEGMELIDQVLVPSCVASEVLKCIHIGLLCVHENPADRPTMSSVIFMLASDSTITLLCPSEPVFSVGRAIAKPTEPISDDRVFSVNEVTISNFSPR
ncbi:hypothetical protein ES332_A10G018000v1 [Gossypium tomentosum]|uniref:Gnk2-homologous domain-containing protein n=1 Tax=Gossypium tomentosum TaxID=34277 RepID=A0A5D2NK04_GOSTO|nr:hypothetical protein ES332_A10G018000v1 [Gossypium tomentosum]